MWATKSGRRSGSEEPGVACVRKSECLKTEAIGAREVEWRSFVHVAEVEA